MCARGTILSAEIISSAELLNYGNFTSGRNENTLAKTTILAFGIRWDLAIQSVHVQSRRLKCSMSMEIDFLSQTYSVILSPINIYIHILHSFYISLNFTGSTVLC